MLKIFDSFKIPHPLHNSYQLPGGSRVSSQGWLLLLAVLFGISAAVLITSGNWWVAAGMAVAIPAVVLFTNYSFGVFILWLVLCPFLQTTPDDTSRYLYWVLYRAIPPIALCFALFSNRLQPFEKRMRIKPGRDSLIMVLFLGWTLMNILSHHPTGFNNYIFTLYDQTIVPFFLYWWLRCIAPNTTDLRRLIPGALALALFQVGIGAISWLSPDLLPQDWVGYTSGRTIGTLGYVHAYSVTLIFFGLLLFHAGINQNSATQRLALVVGAGLCIAGVFFSFSRGAWLGGAAALAGLFIIYPKPVLKLSLTLLLSIAILGGSILNDQIAYAQERLNSEQTAMVRFVIWDAGLQMIRLKPLTGWGYGDYRVYAGQFQRPIAGVVATKQHASHNTFISFAAELGIPGLLLYLSPAIWWFYRSIKRRHSLLKSGYWSSKYLVVLWLFLLAHGIISFFSDIRTSQYGLSLWWIALGWIATLVDPYLPRPIFSQAAGQRMTSKQREHSTESSHSDEGELIG